MHSVLSLWFAKNFGCQLETNMPGILKKIVIVFWFSCLCENGFSILVAIKIKYPSRWDSENDLWLEIANADLNTEAIVSFLQVHYIIWNSFEVQFFIVLFNKNYLYSYAQIKTLPHKLCVL